MVELRHLDPWTLRLGFAGDTYNTAVYLSQAAEAMDEVCTVANIVLASRDDETLLHGSDAPEACVRRISGLGVSEVILRDGGAGAYLSTDGDVRHIAARPVERVIDTTAAGDAFAGAYLAARLAGHTPMLAAGLGNGVAAAVIQHPGAITPPGIRLSPGAPGHRISRPVFRPRL
jgi:2-dehydro-3-deoxygluconokinase